MAERRTDDSLTRLLRAGDPAAGDPGLDPAERARMRQSILDAGGAGRRQPARWLLPAAAAMALLALALGLAQRQPQAPTLAAERATPGAAATPHLSGQQVQFVTDGGTLVVWVLRPRSTG